MQSGEASLWLIFAAEPVRQRLCRLLTIDRGCGARNSRMVRRTKTKPRARWKTAAAFVARSIVPFLPVARLAARRAAPGVVQPGRVSNVIPRRVKWDGATRSMISRYFSALRNACRTAADPAGRCRPLVCLPECRFGSTPAFRASRFFTAVALAICTGNTPPRIRLLNVTFLLSVPVSSPFPAAVGFPQKSASKLYRARPPVVSGHRSGQVLSLIYTASPGQLLR